MLVRPYIKPVDLFLHIDKLYNINFSKLRIKAEKKAWKNLRKTKSTGEDITLDDIYNMMPDKLKYLKDKEIELEKKVLKINSEIYEIYKCAKESKKKIIITSDMYLPESVIKEILEVNNIKYDKLYLSNIYSKRKDSGSLYEFIQKDLNIPYEKIFHIGDNKHSDVNVPKNFGIVTEHYPNIVQNFLSENPKYENFYLKNRTAAVSFMLATSIFSYYFYQYEKENANYWNKIGSMIGGPICFSFLYEIAKNFKQNNIDTLLFVARDGYSLKKIYDKCFKENEQTIYTYAPRFVKNLFDSNRNKEIQDSYISYIENLNLKNLSVGIIDTISMSFSAQTLIEKILNTKIYGYYFAALVKKNKNASKYKYESFLPVNKKLSYANFIEFLISAPEKPILYMQNRTPVYEENISKYEEIKIKIYPEISNTEIAYAEYIIQIVNKVGLPYDKSDIMKYLEYLSKHPSKEDITNFEQIKNGIDATNSAYVSIFPDWYYKKYKIFNFPVIVIKENYQKKVIKFLGINIYKKRKDNEKNRNICSL